MMLIPKKTKLLLFGLSVFFISCNKNRETIFSESKLEIHEYYFEKIYEKLLRNPGCKFDFCRGRLNGDLYLDGKRILDYKNCFSLEEKALDELNKMLLETDFICLKIDAKNIIFTKPPFSYTGTKKISIIKTEDTVYLKKEFPNYKLIKNIKFIDGYKKIIIHIEDDYYLKLSDEW